LRLKLQLRNRDSSVNRDDVLSFDNGVALAFKYEALSLGEDSYDLSRCDECEGAGGKTALHEISDLGLWFCLCRHG